VRDTSPQPTQERSRKFPLKDLLRAKKKEKRKKKKEKTRKGRRDA
jgi:hypothetical protein